MATTPKTEGLYCLPTATKFHLQDLGRSVAWAPNQICYFLEAIQTVEEGGYPFQVVLTSFKDLGWDVDQKVDTQHAEVRKELPPRRVAGIIFADGERDGVMPHEGVGLPHWEAIDVKEDGSVDMSKVTATKMRILSRRQQMEELSKQARDAKKSA